METKPLSMDELKDPLYSLKSNKSPGYDDMSYDVMKCNKSPGSDDMSYNVIKKQLWQFV